MAGRSSTCLFAVVCAATCLARRVIALNTYKTCTGNLPRVNDGNCDTLNNIPSCEYDGGDCCPTTCVSTTGDCTEDARRCLDPSASDYPYAEYEDCGGNLPYIQDGICDPFNNNPACGYDGGDCCPSTCLMSSNGYCPEATDECTDPSAVDFAFKEYANCSGYLPLTGDGRCDHQNNNAECGYDGGDCCEGTCIPGRYSCVGFTCIDPTGPSALSNTGNLRDTTSSCLSNVSRQWVVEDTAGATDLANSVVCTGGVFDVEWRGHVVVTETIWITGRTAVNITGVGVRPAIADGKGESRIFGVINASLHVHDMELTHGSATAGGALFVAGGTVTLSGSTSFINNTAVEHGGAVFADSGASISWDGNTTIAHNSCTWHGGAIHIRGRSTVFWSGNTTFSSNRVDTIGPETGSSFGGALYAVLDSTFSWSGNTKFIGNGIGLGDISRDVFCYGGVLSLEVRSSASWSGNTTFQDNDACFCGGALHANDSGVFSWEGTTVFSKNQAGHGGAMCLEGTSSASWSGKTAFVENNVNESGGAVYVTTRSSVFWNAPTAFYENSAHNGGAMHVGGSSDLSWSGDAIFQENNASDSGGGLFVGEGVEVSWSGQTVFSRNYAGIQGGAVISALNGVSEALGTSLSIDGATRFSNNYGGSYGGALMVSGPVSLSFGSEDIVFEENTAGSAGGAVVITGIGVGPVFRGVTFASNFAQIGGAVYSTGTGTTISASAQEFPLTYDRCNFTFNTGTASGGAVESAAGKDYIVDTSFTGNMAREGGGLRLAGTASLSNCWFANNRADIGGGPAVSNVGFVQGIDSCSFFSNDIRCRPGQFLDFIDGDRYSVVCSGCSPCQDCAVANNSEEPTCTDVIEHTTSTGNTIVLETLLIDPGYWRATPSSWDVLACYNADACLGGMTASADYCGEGYEGPYCAVCSDGYAESLSFTCSTCSDKRARVVAMLVVPAVVILVLIFVVHMVSKEGQTAGGGRLHRLKQFLPFQSFKIVIVAWQIMTGIAAVVNVSFPTVYKRFLDGAHVLNFDIGWVLSAGCFVTIDFHDRVITSTVGPIVTMGVLGLTYAVGCRRNRVREAALNKVRRKHVSVALWITFLIYSSVSSTLFQMFSCETLEDGNTYLRADYRIECSSTKHQTLQIYAGLMILVYPVGVPLAYAVLLFWGRDALQIAVVRNMDDARVQAAVHLSSPYRPGCYYYEVVECGRRVMLTGVVVFIFRNKSGQVAVTLVMACMFALVSEALAPYSCKWDAWISRSGHIIVLFSVFVAFLLKVDVSANGDDSQGVFGGVLVAANVCMILAVVLERIIMAWSVTHLAEPLPPSVHTGTMELNHGNIIEANTARNAHCWNMHREARRAAVASFAGIYSFRRVIPVDDSQVASGSEESRS